MYLLDTDAPAKLLLSYVARDVWALLFLSVIVIWKLRWLFQKDGREEMAAKLRALEEGFADTERVVDLRSSSEDNSLEDGVISEPQQKETSAEQKWHKVNDS
jgi:hypothetical protein